MLTMALVLHRENSTEPILPTAGQNVQENDNLLICFIPYTLIMEIQVLMSFSSCATSRHDIVAWINCQIHCEHIHMLNMVSIM